MDAHLEAEGIEHEKDELYWLSHEFGREWEDVKGQAEKGKIGSKDIYRKEVQYEKGKINYELAIAFFENFEPEYVNIPEAKIEENQETYLVTEGVEGKGSDFSREEAYGYASEMTLLGETDWDAYLNFKMTDTPVLVDFEYFTNYRIEEEHYKQNILEPWFRKRGFEFDEGRFDQEMERRARNLPDTEDVIETLREETPQIVQEKEFMESQLSKLEEALEKAKKGELTVEKISDEIAPAT